MFLQMLPVDRENFARKRNLCMNCFSSNHFVRECRSPRSCRTCGMRHHSLVHNDDRPVPESVVTKPKPDTKVVATAMSSDKVALSVVEVMVVGIEGMYKTLAFLDT